MCTETKISGCHVKFMPESLKSGDLDRLIESLAKFPKRKWIQTEAAKIMVDCAREWSTDLIFRHIWEKLGLPATLERLLAKTDITAPISEDINGIKPDLRPAIQWISDIYRPSSGALQLHHFYRALDFLIENQNSIEQDLFEETKNLFNLDLDMVFWDTTSTYFEGGGPEGLADYGHSKDHRPDRVQIVVGVLMTRAGIPVAHQVFTGDTADIDTFKAMDQKPDDYRTRFFADLQK